MLDLSNEEKARFLSDGTHKSLELTFPKTDFSRINWDIDSSASYKYARLTNRTKPLGMTPSIYGQTAYYRWALLDYMKYGKGILVSVDISFVDLSFASTPAKIRFGVGWRYVEGDPSSDVYLLEDLPYDPDQTLFVLNKRVPIPEGNPTRFIYLYFEAVDSDNNTIGLTTTRYEVSHTHVVLLNDMDQEIDLANNTCNFIYYNLDLNELLCVDNERSAITNSNIEAESLYLTESVCSDNNLKFGACEASNMSISVVDIFDNISGKEYTATITCDNGDPVPLGHFRIDSVKSSYKGHMIKKKITAYDPMARLDVSASEWFSKYMKGANIYGYEGLGFQYTRQMFSAFDSISKWHGIMWKLENVQLCNVIDPTEASSYQRKIYDNDGNEIGYYTLGLTTIEAPDGFAGKIFCVSRNRAQALEEVFRNVAPNIADDGCGIGENGSYLVTETTASGKTYNYLVDSNNWWAVHDDCISLSYYSPYRIVVTDGQSTTDCYRGQAVSCADMPFYLPNSATKLVYYDWQTREIASNSNITARNVLESLAEINGAFARYDRNGNFQFYRIRTQGLYPSNTLYPDDSIFPVDNGSERLTKAHYREYISQDYEVSAFGKIQIVTNKAVKDFVGSDSPNTYVMDKNVFYSANNVNYLPDTSTNVAINIIPEVEEMLSIMFEQIRRSSYVPYKATAQGCPWLEAGDRISVLTGFGGEETFIFRRTLKGIQTLTDSFSASGDETNQEIRKYGKDWSEGNE